MSGKILDRFGEPIHYCASPGCTNRATVYPEVVVPPRGHPITRGVRAVITLMLCRKHGKEEKAETFLTDRFRAMLTAQVARSPVPLDFDRASIRLGVIGDPRWKSQQAVAEAARQSRERAN